MATNSGQLRQGLPRVVGGEPWPANGVAPGAAQTHEAAPAVESVVAEPPAAPVAPAVEPVVPAVSSVASTTLRQGLPRVPGGAPWPEGGSAPVATVAASAPAVADVTVKPDPVVEAAPVAAPAEAVVPAKPVAQAVEGAAAIRQGLPRVASGDPWPPAGSAPAWTVKTVTASVEAPVVEAPAAETPVVEAAAVEAPAAPATQAPKAKQEPVAKPAPVVKPAPVAKPQKTPREPIMIGAKSLAQWVKIVVLGGLGAIAAAAILVLAARGVTTLPGVPEFMERYPGEYQPAAPVDPGFPAWARWTHFLNIFLMVLIIRSGILVRTQQKPPAFWTPKKGGKKISINLWLHTSLDIIWLVNGVIFVVLLFISGHWLRIIPTSLEVFPNAASAMLQYMTLDWPAENGWNNYNSLQQIMYFTIVFIAAPLAAITGARMSEWWPEKAERLNKIYPAPLARAIHFPVMLFFVLFILVHVFLVFSTGALVNLNHMFAGTQAVNWTGFWLFALAIAITAAGWFAARPLILAPIANLFGKVSNR